MMLPRKGGKRKLRFDLENSACPKDQCKISYVAISEHLSAEKNVM
jgi:hypothetical protein